MAEQFIVATFLDGTLNVSACGPYRSLEKAERIACEINDAADWTQLDPENPTIIAQVVPLITAQTVIEAATPEEEVL